MDPRRTQRVSEALREEISELVEYELKDPRLGGVTVTEAHLSPDGRHARVVVALRGDEQEQKNAMDALDHAKNYLRREVASRLRLFRAPDLVFEEETAGGQDRIEQLLTRIRKNREKTEKSSDK